MEEENKSISWKSLLYSVPKGILSWASRAITDSLTTQNNLARWKKIVDPKCKLCFEPGSTPRIGTLHHILNDCPKMLKRYEWTHNSILHYISSILRDTKNEKFKVFADLDGFKVNGRTIQANIIQTTKRPDLVIIETTERKEHVKLFELTVPFEKISIKQ